MKKQCYKVVSSVDTLFAHEKKFDITCETVKYEGETIIFYSDNETKIEASFYRPFSVEYDSSGTMFANLSLKEKQEYNQQMWALL